MFMWKKLLYQAMCGWLVVYNVFPVRCRSFGPRSIGVSVQRERTNARNDEIIHKPYTADWLGYFIDLKSWFLGRSRRFGQSVTLMLLVCRVQHRQLGLCCLLMCCCNYCCRCVLCACLSWVLQCTVPAVVLLYSVLLPYTGTCFTYCYEYMPVT